MNKNLLNLTAGKNFAGWFFCVLLQIPEKFGILNMYEKKQTKRNSQKRLEIKKI